MNSKGDVSMAQVMAATIGIILLVIVVVPLIDQNNAGLYQSWRNILPVFGSGGQEQGQLGDVRYDVLTGDVRHFDGNSWNSFKDPIEFYSLSSPLGADDAKRAFDEYFLSTKIRAGKEIYKSASLTATAIELADDDYIERNALWFDKKIYSRGAVIANIKPADGALLGTYYVNIDGSAVYLAGNGQPKDEPQIDKSQLVLNAVEWRDSVLSTPMHLGGSTFCVRKEESHYLFINLERGGQPSC